MEHQNSYAPKKGNLAPLKEVLEQWLRLNDRFYLADNDLISCYTELSCVSHFNAALWSSPSGSWVGLQEYQDEKRANTRGRKKQPGRVDLFFKHKKNRYVAEAKRVYINLKSLVPSKLSEKLNEKVWLAWEDVKKNVEQHDAENLIAITFFDFQYPCEDMKVEKEYEVKIEEYIRQIEKNLFDAGAYWFLKKPILADGWAYCGTYLVIENYNK